MTCDLDHPAVRAALQADPPQKPPSHFHPHQAEYFQVLQGQAVVEAEIGGRAGMHRLQAGRQGVADDSEFCVPAGAHHTWYPSIAQVEDGRERNDSTNDISSRRDYGVSRVVVSGDTTPELLRLDWAFFENWYSYQDACFKKGRAIDLIQVMCVSSSVNYLPCHFNTQLSRGKIRQSHSQKHAVVRCMTQEDRIFLFQDGYR